MQYDLWQLFAVFWDKMSLNHSTKRLSPQQHPWSDCIVGWSTTAHTQLPHALLLAFSPSCWISFICLLCPSPKEASIKSPLKMRMGLDSNKLEQNNLFTKNPTPTPAPHHHACSCLSHIVSGRSRKRCCEAESSSCLPMRTILMWADSIRQHFRMPHTLPSFTASLQLLMSLLPNVSAKTRQTAWQSAALQPLLWLLTSSRATV